MRINAGQLRFLWNGGETKRYHGFRTINEDTVGQHSFNVACIIMVLRPDASAALLRAALKHDVAEHITGDMPAPTKRGIPGLREAFGKYEAEVAALCGVDLEDGNLTDDERYILKVADAMDGMRFCIVERSMGNRRIDEVFIEFSKYVKTLLDEKGTLQETPEKYLFGLLWADWRSING